MICDVVFEGGGAKGIALVGSWEIFLKEQLQPGRMIGTSAGAIMAALVAAGYSLDEMRAALTEEENGKPLFAGFLADPAIPDDEPVDKSAIATFLRNVDIPGVPEPVEAWVDRAILRGLRNQATFRHIYSFVEWGGWYSADRFLTWMRDKLNLGSYQGEPRAFGDMTLDQFFRKTGSEVSFVATDTTGARLLVLNHNTAPNCPLVYAVRMSMSIPLLWHEVIWQEAWNPYLGKSLTGHAIVDGGVLSNFPLELLLSELDSVTQLMGPKTGNPVLGFLIDESLPLESVLGSRPGSPRSLNFGELQTVLRLRRLVDAAISARDKMVIDAYAHLVVRLPAHGYGTTEFDMSEERRESLVEAGRRATTRHLKQYPPMGRLLGPALSPEAQRIADRIATDILRP
jgi:NTE family protein